MDSIYTVLASKKYTVNFLKTQWILFFFSLKERKCIIMPHINFRRVVISGVGGKEPGSESGQSSVFS